MNTEITIIRPDDWHLHLRDGEMLAAVLPATSRIYGRAIIMPNLMPPVTNAVMAEEYRKRIIEVRPEGSRFEPLMTCYLTDSTSPEDIHAAYAVKAFHAVKLFPAGATTNSASGVTDIKNVYPVLEAMQEIGLPLSVHGEVVDPDVDVFDREAVFIDRVLEPVHQDFPELKIIFEHLTSKIAVDYVFDQDENMVATITPHHLLLTRNDLFKGGMNPYMYCLPVAKTFEDRNAIREAATSGDERFFLGTDSAPHPSRSKEKAGAAAGIFNAPTSIGYVTQVFDELKALDKLEGFASIYGARFYGLSPNGSTVTLAKREHPVEMEGQIVAGNDVVKIFKPDTPLYWELVD
ncbi:dihydroorotase [Maridesulfovibrio hydrothermalis]|uniref:Dihydroorotase n=1 Tax=Maridesulfovibrio hydrothermalis AM13 = DSM 14728 TaxID=1121451 RepID=L0RC43_9BACT|nr:dihydroorotase [Maridesulfovibrio hydrothermalis]CCO24348.1 dihydro-orotase [Maridesulfovibrio hydrothermalis AM13 = DSM 14728]